MSLSNNYDISNNKICSNIENDSSFYVFEIKIYSNSDNNIENTFKKISYNKEGVLLNINNNITKIKIAMCNINNTNKIINIRKNFTSTINKPIILCRNNLIIKLDNINDKIVIEYVIL